MRINVMVGMTRSKVIFIFPYELIEKNMGIIIPFDFHIFQRGRSTTNQSLFDPQTHNNGGWLPIFLRPLAPPKFPVVFGSPLLGDSKGLSWPAAGGKSENHAVFIPGD